MCEVKRRMPSQYSGLKIIALTNLDYGGVLVINVSIRLDISLFKIVSIYLVYN
jgi:hypothetical protein